MAEGASQKSPWASRLAILGALFLVIGAILVSAQKETIDSVYDPRQISITEIVGEGSVTFEVEQKGCYMAIVMKGESDMDVTFTPIDGSAAASEDLSPKSCFSDWAPMASDGEVFEIHEEWIAEESGEMLAQSTCNEGCEGQTVWIVHVDNWALELLNSTGLVFGFAICCLGFLFLPVAGILAYSARSNTIHGTVRVIDGDEGLLQSFGSQEEMLEALHDVNSPIYMGSEKEDVGEISGSDDGFVDGSKDVMQGTLMTTEQVYAFMRGDAPEEVHKVSDPFADSPTPVTKAVERPVANITEISDWDAGGANESLKSSTPSPRPKQKEIKAKETDSNGWSAWDDL